MVLMYCLDWSVRQSIHLIVHAQSSTSSHSLPSPLLPLSPLSPPSQHSQTSHLSPCYTSLHPFTHLLHHITPMLHHCNTLLHFRLHPLTPLSEAVHKWRHHVLGGPRLPPPPCLHVLQMIIKKKQASCKWSSRKTCLLQMIIWRIRPLANDHLKGPSSCKWSSHRYGLLQMII